MDSSVSPFEPLTRQDLARILDVSLRTVDAWSAKEILPAKAEVEGRVYWHPRIFYEWLDAILSTGKALPASSVASSPVGASSGVLSQGPDALAPQASPPAKDRAAGAEVRCSQPRLSRRGPVDDLSRRLRRRDVEALARVLGQFGEDGAES
jgi:hypothetical protein